MTRADGRGDLVAGPCLPLWDFFHIGRLVSTLQRRKLPLPRLCGGVRPSFSETGKYGTAKTDKTPPESSSVSFGSSKVGHSEKTRGVINPHDRSTWPPYLVRLERRSREAFGPEAARRQVTAELAFAAVGSAPTRPAPSARS